MNKSFIPSLDSRCLGLFSSMALIFALSVNTPATAAGNGLTPAQLRCEYRVDPLGLQETSPRLSWIVESAQRGQNQTAYQVLVAGSESALKKNTGDLWDSGKVASDETTAIVYAGKPLGSGLHCFWKLKVWDKDGKESAWSKPASWSMGLLDASEWKADWIGFDKVREIPLPPAEFGGAKWIGHAADPALKAPKGHRLYLSTFSVPENAKVQKAELLVTADDKCKFILNTHQVATVSGWNQPQQVDIANNVKPGVNDIRVEVETGEEGPTGLLARIVVTLADGKQITHLTDSSWKSTDKPGANWHNRAIDASAWPVVQLLGDYGMQPWGKLQVKSVILPAPYFLRTGFKTEKPVSRATLYATGLGLFDLYLNGKRVTEDYFSPGWTDYTKRVYYRSYDVTDRVRKGDNALGAIVADGWFSGYVGYGHNRDHYGKLTRVRAQLMIQYADGTSALVGTSPAWKATVGPILEGDFLMGETYDARLTMDGWDSPGFDDSKWSAVSVGSSEVQPKVEVHPGPAVRPFNELRAKTITEVKPGTFVLNLGQNFAGVPRLKIKGEAGQKITLRFAERLNPDGTIYTINLRSARATDTYICRGKGVEVWQPRFTFHGFQYIEITGLKGKPAEDTVVGVALSSDTPVVGKFECSDAMLNQLHSNAYWTQRMNFIDIPTDCPQRDERLGWTGDAQVYVRTATLNTDVQAFFTKWLVDLCQDGQRADGQFPMVAPVKVAGPDGGPAWADAGVICPWTIYEVYGDRRVLERNYEAMTRFISFCQNRCRPGLLPPEKYHCFGDWLNINAPTPNDVIYEAYFAYCTKLVARSAAVLGKKEDAAKYLDLFQQIKAAFNKAYVAEDGRIKGDTQTCYVLAIMVGLLDGEKEKLAAKYLVENIEARDCHLSTGFIGTKDLMLALSKIGRNDIAYRLIHNDSFPSWGFSIKHGATSIWERWNGWTPDKGFGDPGMNSFAHYSFGAVYQWMVENIGGIRNDAPAYKRIVIAPQFDGKLTHADVSYDCIRGHIESAWKTEAGKLTLTVAVPANTSATVLVPAKNSSDVTESGKPLDKAAGVKFVRMEGDRAVLEIESGSYRFEVKN